ncbi:MAG: amidohydrolase family protein [Acidobacteria bacterium]|nr:amidohydrolase family protein [Acidobacteriota bacterium]
MMMRKTMTALLVLILCNTWGWAQQTDVNSLLGHPQMILHNGKIVSMDDDSFEARVGTITQAMAVRDGKILATGSNDVIRALAGPETQSIDLQGRTVLPSLILTHEHPTDWMFQEPRAITHVLPNDDMVIHRWLPSIPPKQQLALFDTVMQEALAKAKPGQWVLLSFNWGLNYEWAIEMGALFRDSIKKEYLDQLAPNNPVKVKNGFITSVVNQKALDEERLVHPELGVLSDQEKQGYGFNRPMEPDVVFRGKTPVLANILKAEMELWARYGITTFGSSPYAYHNFQALDSLDKRGEMPGRFAWGYTGPEWSTDILRYLSGMLGHGTDHLWLVGAWGGSGSRCMSIPTRAEWEQIREQYMYAAPPRCSFAPGTPGRVLLERIIENGLRVATMHTGGDKDIDYYMDAIEAASKRAGFTLEQIQAKRHAFDHGEGAPRPNQIPRIKRLGMIVSEINTNLWEPQRGVALIARQYGVEYTSWVVPRKALTDAGVRTSFEIDRPMPQKIFFFVLKGINRYHDYDQRVYGPDQRTDRIIQLKALTRWGAYYLLREDRLGTLEPGKFADFIVLDKDFLTIPEDQIPDIQVLMTSVGGKVVHMVSSMAGEAGMEPVGATTWTEEIPEGW